jgi:hypothetical protein
MRVKIEIHHFEHGLLTEWDILEEMTPEIGDWLAVSFQDRTRLCKVIGNQSSMFFVEFLR